MAIGWHAHRKASWRATQLPSLAARKSDIYTVNKTIVAVSGAYGKLIVSRPLDELEQTIADRAANPSEKSYTTKLLNGGVEAIGAKVVEEAAEVVEAAGELGEVGREHFVREVGDLVYHLLVLMRQKNCSLAELDAELARRFGVSGLEEKASRNMKDSGFRVRGSEENPRAEN
jgi:phosphoribosyl-ATP pyrophosphohydrolase